MIAAGACRVAGQRKGTSDAKEFGVMNERFEKATALTDAMMGPDFTAAMRKAAESGAFAGDMARLSMEQAFGDVWMRDGLERRHRSIVVIAILIAQGQPAELKNHIRFGLNNGLSVREIEEILIQAQPYVGWPAVSSATSAAIEVLRERGLIGDAQTSEERGVL